MAVTHSPPVLESLLSRRRPSSLYGHNIQLRAIDGGCRPLAALGPTINLGNGRDALLQDRNPTIGHNPRSPRAGFQDSQVGPGSFPPALARAAAREDPRGPREAVVAGTADNSSVTVGRDGHAVPLIASPGPAARELVATFAPCSDWSGTVCDHLAGITISGRSPALKRLKHAARRCENPRGPYVADVSRPADNCRVAVRRKRHRDSLPDDSDAGGAHQFAALLSELRLRLKDKGEE
jgi:hypothetical protein